MSSEILPLVRQMSQFVLYGALILAFFLIGLGIYKKQFKLLSYVLPVTTWLTHAFSFYTYVLFIKAPGLSEIVTTWSLGLRFHAVTLIVGALLYEVFIDPRVKIKKL